MSKEINIEEYKVQLENDLNEFITYYKKSQEETKDTEDEKYWPSMFENVEWTDQFDTWLEMKYDGE